MTDFSPPTSGRAVPDQPVGIDVTRAISTIPARWRAPRADLERRISWTPDAREKYLALGKATKARDVMIIGVASVGKTTLASLIFSLFVERRCAGARTELAAFYACRVLGTVRDREELEAARRSPLAVLDDVGAEEPTVFGRAAIGSVIGHRHDWELPTIFTTGLTDVEAVAAYGDGIARRLFERSMIIRLGAQR